MAYYEYKQSDLIDFIHQGGYKTRQKGNEIIFKYCPICEGGKSRDTETFYVNVEKEGLCECKRASCGFQGNFYKLAKECNFDLDLGEIKTYRSLSNFTKEPTPTEKACNYFRSRGISPQTVTSHNVTTSKQDDNILCFPFYKDNELVSVKYRIANFDKNIHKNKEWCERETKPVLFGTRLHDKSIKTAVITEGQIDSMSVYECGIKNAFSVPLGANGFTWFKHEVDFLTENFETIIVFGDYEKGDITLYAELEKRLTPLGVEVKVVQTEDYLDCKDANEILQKYGAEQILKCVENAKVRVSSRIKDITTYKVLDDNKKTYKLGLWSIDKCIKGVEGGMVVLIQAKAGCGKSTISSQFTLNLVNQGLNVFAYSGELQGYTFQQTLYKQLLGNREQYYNEYIDEYGDKETRISVEGYEKAHSLLKNKYYLYDNGIIEEKVEPLTKIVVEAITKNRCNVILVDNLMTLCSESDSDELYTLQGRITKALKKIAIQYDVIVFLIAHSKKGQGELDNDSISGSSNVANYVDVVINIQKAIVEGEKHTVMGISKNRKNGRILMQTDNIKLEYNRCSRLVKENSKDSVYDYPKFHNIFNDNESENETENIMDISECPF